MQRCRMRRYRDSRPLEYSAAECVDIAILASRIQRCRMRKYRNSRPLEYSAAEYINIVILDL